MKTIAIVLLALLFSCSRDRSIETKQAYLQRVFLDQTIKQQYYVRKFIDASKSGDIEAMMLYNDSATMAYYCSNNAYNEMKITNKRLK